MSKYSKEIIIKICDEYLSGTLYPYMQKVNYLVLCNYMAREEL